MSRCSFPTFNISISLPAFPGFALPSLPTLSLPFPFPPPCPLD